MPTSQYEPSATLRPAAPDGYGDPEEFHYSLPIMLALILLLVGPALFVFGTLLWDGQGAALADFFGVTVTDDAGFEATIPIAIGGVFVAAVVVVTVLHELVHGLVFRLQGYRVSYGAAPQLGAFYAAAFHQFQARNDTILVGIAPLIVLDALLVPLFFVPIPVVAVFAFVAVLFNTLGAAGDIYLLARLLRMPRGTLLYDSDIRHSYVLYPEA
ncbi:DUF3267 domain-containing protein [Haloarcula pelagica]|uniref:DUF3267 domain-containing protein n=1 Tax=Haloarcula pelagica TaxID=3033389 RepID=UPI0024C3E174|nr:DUF3267 domain-containing protein [Halomicroarcula sp. YJ-61-S]